MLPCPDASCARNQSVSGDVVHARNTATGSSVPCRGAYTVLRAPESAGIEPERGPRDLRRLAKEGALGEARAERLVPILQERNALAHEYPDLRARKVYDAATLLERELGPFVRELTMWLVSRPPDRA